MRHEGVEYSLLGSDTAICGILVGEKAELQRSHSGVTWEELHGCVYYISMVILWRAVLHKVKTPKQ